MNLWQVSQALSEAVRVLLIMSATGSAVGLMLLALKPLIRVRLPKAAQYYLWLIVTFAYLTPLSVLVSLPVRPSISGIVNGGRGTFSQSNLPSRTEQTEASDGSINETAGGEFAQPTSEAAERNRTGLLDYAFIILPVLGFCVVLIKTLAGYFKYLHLLRERNIPPQPGELELLHSLCGKKPPRLYRNRLADTPMLIGIIHPMILLPDKKYTDGQLQAVLLHELTHLRRKDVLVKWATIFTCALHWFNPVAWLTRREIDRACELACDEAAVIRLSGESKLHYCDTLVRMAADSVPRSALSTTMCEEKKMLKERLVSVMKGKQHTKATVAATVFIASAAVIIAVLLGAGNANAADTQYDPLSRKVVPRLWVDYESYEDDSFWSAEETLTLDVFPGVVFKWNADKLTATDDSGVVTTLITGMPIWDVYLMDINRDKLPEFCATVSFGSGIVDTHVAVYDYANRQLYELWDRMVYDYKLATDGEGQLTVSQYAYNGDISIASGSLYIENGQLIASGISRATPTPPQDAPPTGTPSPDAIDAGDAAAAPVPGAPVITRGATVTRKQNTGGTDAGSVPAKARTAETTMYEGILEVTKALHEYSAGLNGGIKYIAFDLTNIPQDERGETDEFADYLKKWAESLKLEPLFGTYDDMVEAGYIIPITPDTLSEAGFTEGVRFSFRDVELEGNVLTLNVVKYRGPLGVMGADYTAKFEDGVWTVGEPENVLVA